MASPLMSPPHNGTPFIYFTERLSLVISTALKSYYFYVNDEWIKCGCQEQYLFVSCGQPWLCFNSISPLPLSVIDNWCGLTSLSEDAEFFRLNHGARCHFRVFTGGAFCCLQQRQFAVTDDDLTLMRSAGSCSSREQTVQFKMLHGAILPVPLGTDTVPSRLSEIVPLRIVVFFSCVCFWHRSKLLVCAADWQPRASTESSVQNVGQYRWLQRLVLHNTARGNIRFSFNFSWTQLPIRVPV